MGAGASARRTDDENWDDVPIDKPDLHTDNKIDLRHSRQALADQMSFTTDFGRLSPQSKLTDDPYATDAAERLRIQATSHWHRIMSHAREQREFAQENSDAVPCPVCGQPIDDPQFCGFCGDVEEATKEHIRALEEQSQAQAAQLNRSSSSGHLGLDGGIGSPPSPGRKTLLGSFINSTRNLLAAISPSGSPGSPGGSDSPSSQASPTSNGGSSFRRSFNTTKHDGKGSSLINLDAEQEDMNAVVGTLLESSLTGRNRGRGSSGEGKNTSGMKARIKEIEKEERDLARRAERAEQWRLEQERRNEVRRFVGLGLDSDPESEDDNIDYETKLLKRQLKDMLAAEKERNDGVDDDARDDSDAEGATAWQRSPFYRLLNANTIKASHGKKAPKGVGAGAGGAGSPSPDVYSEEEEAADMEIVGEAPHPPLPPVAVELKRRDAHSIEIAWDVSAEALSMLMAVRQAYGKTKQPLYQVQYRAHTSSAALAFAAAAAAAAAADESDSAKVNDAIAESKDAEKDPWKLAIRRTPDLGGVLSGLHPNTSYQIRCRRIGWCEGWHKAVPVVIRSGPGAPTAPRGLSAREVSSESILVSWNAPEKDNGLPVLEYIVQMKPYGGAFTAIYQGRERCHLCTALKSNAVHVFQILAINKAGKSPLSERLAVRTLPPGAAALSPWVEVVDERAHKLFYCHTKTNAIAWKLPVGAIVDEIGSFRNKRSYLANQMARRMAHICTPYGVAQRPLQINIDRRNLLEGSLRVLHHTPAEEVDQGPVRVHFVGEDGLDAGGLAKDWFVEVAKRLFDDSTGLLTVNEETGYVTIDQRAASIHSVPESVRLFRAIGTFFAKAVIDGQTLGVNLDPLLLCLMSGRVPTLDLRGESDGSSSSSDFASAKGGAASLDPAGGAEGSPSAAAGDKSSNSSSSSSIGSMSGKSILELTEPQFYRGLMWVLRNDVAQADLTFTCSYELFDESHTIELVPYGQARPVTEANKHEYIQRMSQWLLRERYEPALSSLLEGFQLHVNVQRHMTMFSIGELQMLLGGVADIDIKDITQKALFGGFVSQSDEVLWLFRVLDEFDREMLSKFFSFVSGCPRVPVDGLKPPLLITRMEDGKEESLPRAHTCFNQIVLPRYSSFEVLKARLTYALENASEGFFIS